MKHTDVTLFLVLFTTLWATSLTSNYHTVEENDLPHNANALDSNLGTVLFLSATFLLGALTRHAINKYCPELPYTVTLLALGLVIGLPFKYYETKLMGYLGLLHLDPHLLMYIFLPVLLFESAFLLDIHAMKKSIGQILVLAIPGYLLSSLLTAVVVMYIFSYNWSWSTSMMVGAIISATDPVAVVALLKNSPGGKDVHHLSIVIEGESLLNDGAAIVMFSIFQDSAMAPCEGQNYSCVYKGELESFNSSVFCDHYMHCDVQEAVNVKMCTMMTASDIVIDIVRKAIGGPLLGAFVGYIITFWLGKVFNDSLTEITITVGSPYLVYFISEMFLQSSGVLSVVTFGVVVNMNKMNISPEIESFLNKFWEQMGYLVNTIIFLLVGMIITFSAIDNIEAKDIIYLLVLYIGISVSRTLMLLIFHFILSRMGYGSTWQSASVLMWGALRGAVSLALALQVQHNAGFCEAMRSKILFFVSGIVVLTLLINSTTFNKVLHILGFCHISKAKKSAVDSAALRITEAMNEELDRIKHDTTLTDSHWDEVEKICFIDTIYNTDKDITENRSHIDRIHDKVTACGKCSYKVAVPLTKLELSEFYDEARNRILKAFKISLWKQFDSGLLNKAALRFLDDMCDHTVDIKDKFIGINNLEYMWQIGPVLRYIKAKLENWQKGRKHEEYPIPNNVNQYKVYQVISSSAFELVIMLFIFINVVIVIVELSISQNKCESVTNTQTGLPELKTTELSSIFSIVNYCFLGLFIMEMVLKLIGQRKYYFYHKWNLLDFLIILISLADSITDIFTDCESANINFNVFRIIRIVRLFRCVRLMKWVFLVLHQIVKKLINKSLSSGYDVGIGFIMASDDVIEHIKQIVTHGECKLVFLEQLRVARYDVMSSLGKLRKEYPGIPIAIRTRQAIRIVLNKGRACAWGLLDDGHIDDFDSALFTKQIEEKMKRLLANSVHWLPPPDAFTLFAQAPWLKNLKGSVILNVVKCAKHQMYSQGEVFLKKGEIAAGVYLIISGKARVVHSLEYTQSKTSVDNAPVHKSHSVHLACHHSHNSTLGPGTILGEQSILVNRPRGSYVVCETDLQCYFIPAEQMHGLMLRHPRIEEKLWRLCSVRMAESLLARNVKYKTRPFEELKSICERSVLATLVPETNNGIFEIDNIITDVVIIYGEARCFPSNNLLVGPKCVTAGSTKLSLITPCKLLIILNQDYQIDLKQYNSTDDTTDSVKKLSVADEIEQSLPTIKTEVVHDNDEDVKLSNIIKKDLNPNTREQFEKNRRRSYMRDSSSPGPIIHCTHNDVPPDSKLPPVENVEKKMS